MIFSARPTLSLPLDLGTHAPARGYLDRLGEDAGGLRIAGWLLLPGRCFDRLVLHVRGEHTTREIAIVSRPDVAAARGDVALERCGFDFVVPLDGVDFADPATTFEAEILGLVDDVPAGGMAVGYHRDTDHPAPPAAMMLRATGNADPVFWRATGIKACHDCRRLLAPFVDLGAVTQVLEWGCGSGRLSRHLIDRFPDARVCGVDIDGDAVAWAGAHLRGHFVRCQTLPPLPFDDGSFDLIVGLSVMSHLTAPFQELWLQELRRVLRPGGVVLLSTHGPLAAEWEFRDPEQRAAVLAAGLWAEQADPALGDLAPPDYYRATYQTPEWTRRVWSRHLDVLHVAPAAMNNYQDVYILRRPLADRSGAGDPTVTAG